MRRQPSLYILASRPRGTLYIGVTSCLLQRIWQHRSHLTDGFTCDYDVRILVYFEMLDDMRSAIAREKQLKKWNRQWKIELIESFNSSWRDLYPELI